MAKSIHPKSHNDRADFCFASSKFCRKKEVLPIFVWRFFVTRSHSHIHTLAHRRCFFITCLPNWLTHPFEEEKNGFVFESVLITYSKISVHKAHFWKVESLYLLFGWNRRKKNNFPKNLNRKNCQHLFDGLWFWFCVIFFLCASKSNCAFDFNGKTMEIELVYSDSMNSWNVLNKNVVYSHNSIQFNSIRFNFDSEL